MINGKTQSETCLEAAVLFFSVFYLSFVKYGTAVDNKALNELLCDEQTPALKLFP